LISSGKEAKIFSEGGKASPPDPGIATDLHKTTKFERQ